MRKRWIPSVVLVLATIGFASAQVQTKESQASMTPAQAIERLKEGNRRFVSGERKARD